MFRKLISNLPFQPTLLADVAHYAHRLKQEQAVRRLGMLILLAGFGIQIFTIAFPPQASLATNRSDIIYGATSKQDVLSAYRNDRDSLGRTDIKAIFHHYGIKEEQIEKATKTTVKDSDTSYINTSRSTTKWADTHIKIPGAVDGGIYEFPLSYWRKDQYPNGYPAITGISEYGFRFWILLKGCGNIVYEKGAKKPQLEITKDLTSSSQITTGNSVNYDIRFRNSGPVAANDVTIVDTLPDNLEYVSYTATTDLKFTKSGNTLKWALQNTSSSLGGGSKWQQISLITKATKATSANICNSVSIDASNASKTTAQSGSCVTVAEPKCPGTGLPIPPEGVGACSVVCNDGSTIPYNKSCPTPQLICSALTSSSGNMWNNKTYTATVTKQPGSEIKSVNFYSNDNKIGSQTTPDQNGNYTVSYTHDKAGNYTIKADVEAAIGEVQPSSSCTITDIINQPEIKEPVIVTDKFVENETQNILDANNTTAKPGDVLRYRLTITNKGNAPAIDLPLYDEYAEDVRDILEYAEMIDLGDAALNKETHKLSWPSVTINPGDTVTKSFAVKVMNPLPATPVSLSNPLSYDFSMHNKYGRTVVVNLDKPASKTIEESVSTLPNTGPSSSSMMLLLVVVMVGYFYYRNRLLSKELSIIQKEFQSGV